MYEGKILGKKVKFTNREYSHLVRKWNPKNITTYPFRGPGKGHPQVKGQCVICKKHPGCSRCPILHCQGTLRKILGPGVRMNFGGRTIFYRKRAVVEGYMEKIQAILSKFKKV